MEEKESLVKNMENIKTININSNNDSNNNFGETLEIETKNNITKSINKELFLKVIENDMLKSVPVELQSRLSVQKDIHTKANELYNLIQKTQSVLKKEEKEGQNLNNIYDNLKDGNFNKVHNIYPVVLDERIIYNLKCNNNEMVGVNLDSNNIIQHDDEYDLTIKSGKVPYGDKLKNQIENLKDISNIYKQRYKNEINITTFYTKLQEKREPYKEPSNDYWDDYETPKVKKIKLNKYNEVFRYINLDNENRITKRVARGNHVIPLGYKSADEVDNIDKNIKNTIVASSGETINIVGFLYLPNTSEKELILKAVKNKTFLSKNFKLDIKEPSLVLFDICKDKNNYQVDDSEFIKIIKKIIPNDEDIISHILNNDKEKDLINFIKKLKEKGYTLNTITNTSWNKIKDELSSNFEIEKSVNGIDLQKSENKCKISDNELISDNFYQSKISKLVYSIQLNYVNDNNKKFKGEECDIHRSNILFNTKDNGDFYYSYSFLEEKNKININKFKKNKKDLSSNIKVQREINFENNDITKDNLKELKNEFKKLKDIKNNSVLEKDLELADELINNYNSDIKKYEKTVIDKCNFIVNKQLEKDIQYKKKSRDAILGRIMKNKDEKNSKNIDKEILFDLDNISPVLKSVLTQINQNDSYEEKKNLLYSIIKLDGFLVDKYIYSLFYKKPFICGHWYYQMLIDNTDNNELKQKYILKMLTLFGDEGKEQDNCKVCGSYLERSKFVDYMYIDKWGNPTKIRDDIIREKSKIKYAHSLPAKRNTFILDLIKNYKSDYFLNYLQTKNIKQEKNIKLAINGSQILNAFLNKLDININNKHFIDLLVVCVRESSQISSLIEYFNDRLKNLKIKKKISDDKINRLRNSQKFIDKIKKEYSKYFSIRYATLIVAHLLWYLRTSVPIHLPGYNSTTSCSFFGFKNDNGFEFFVCIVQEMKLFSSDGKVPKYEISKNLRYWLNNLKDNYEYALLRRENYEKDIKLFDIRQGSNKLNNIPSYLESFDFETTNNSLYSYSYLINSIKKLSLHIKELYDNIIEEAPKTFGDYVYHSHSQCTCCETNVEEKLKFEDYFNDIDKNISKYHNTINIYQNDYKLYNKSLYTTAYYINGVVNPICNKNNTEINLLKTPDEYNKNAFKYYCHTGDTYGEKHVFENMNMIDRLEELLKNKNTDELKKYYCIKCIKCEHSLISIINSTQSRESFVKLMKKISLNSMKKYELKSRKKESKKLLLLKKRYDSEKIIKNIKILAKKIAKYSLYVRNSSDKEKKEKEIFIYVTNFLLNIEDFSNLLPEEFKSKKEKIIKTLNNKKFEIKKLKEYINEYFRKNISKIKNNYKNKTPSKLLRRTDERWQKIVIDKNEWIKPFLNSKNKKIFKKLIFSYKISYVNNIISIPTVYNKNYTYPITIDSFNNKDAINSLKGYFVQEMLSFLEISKSNEPIISDFYLSMFKEIENDKNIINLSNKDITKWKDTITEEKNILKAKYINILKEDKSQFDTPYIKSFEEIYRNPLFDGKILNQVEIDKEDSKAETDEKEEYLRNQAKDTGMGQQDIEDIVQDAILQEEIDNEINEEIYDNIIIDGEEVVEVIDNVESLEEYNSPIEENFNK